MVSVLASYLEITSKVDGEVHALGFLEPKRSVGDQVKQFLVSSFLGANASNSMRKDARSYLLLTEDALHIVAFKGEEFDETHAYPLEELTGVTTGIDETFLYVTFTHGGTEHQMNVMRYQVVSPDESVTTDPAEMQEVGEMTAAIHARLSELG